MKGRTIRTLLLATVALALAAPVFATQPQYTWVYVSDMHCGECAAKIARKLYAVPGVVKVQTHMEKHFAVVTPETGSKLSPRAVWEAVESAEFTPVKLMGPGGIFTTKPGY